ncbi:MAG: branched-chain amino acid ABC transporter permease [Candidatus Kariarchaeaceae archaeon]|jgi:branched-chain amino acid transport system permease protein
MESSVNSNDTKFRESKAFKTFLNLFIGVLSLLIVIIWVMIEISEKGVEVFIQNASLSLVNGLAFSMLLFLMTSGFFLIFGLADIINFAHGAFFMLGGFIGYEVYLLTESFLITIPFLINDPVLLSFVCFLSGLAGSTIVLGLIGIGIEITTIRRLFRKPIAQILLTVGFLYIILQLTEIIWGPAIFTYNYVSGSQTGVFWLPRSAILDLGSGMRFEMYRIFLILFGLVIALGMFLVLSRTRIGLIITAGIEDPEMVNALGIDTKRVFTLVFAVGAALAGLAGAVAVPQVNASLAVAGNFLIYAFIIVVIGGAHFGRFSGTFWASILVGLSYTFCQFFFPGLEGIILFLILLLILTFKPGGLTGEPM